MKFWDSSAIVPLCLTEPSSPVLMRLLDGDRQMAAWWGTGLECVAAFARRRREGGLAARGEADALAIHNALADAWQMIDASTRVMQRALRLVRTHNLSAAHGLQLAAALTWSGESPEGHELVTLDQRLHEAAAREGFAVLPTYAGL